MSGQNYSSPALSIVQDWLAYMTKSSMVETHKEALAACGWAITELGYGVPFDREQKSLNEMLVNSKADKIACLTAWGFYHDYNSSRHKTKRHHTT